jgi:hypothetical protein
MCNRSPGFKSSKSGSTGQCVETAYLTEEIAVRDSKNQGGAVLNFPRLPGTFLAAAKQGEFDTERA